MQRWVVIVIILIAVIQAISRALQEAAKKREQHRLQTASRQSRQPGAARPQAAQPARIQSADPAVRSRADDLASRRKSQLEELRRRRAQKAGRTQPQLRAGSATRVQPAAAPTPFQAPPTRKPGTQPAPQPVQTRRTAKQQVGKIVGRLRQRPPKTVEGERRRRAPRQQAQSTEASRESSARFMAPGVAPVRPMSSSDRADRAAAARASSIRADLRRTGMLRRAIVLKELLDPPISLRETPF